MTITQKWEIWFLGLSFPIEMITEMQTFFINLQFRIAALQ